VVQDYDLAGRWKEIIDEFPMFSFLLADLHPHVLAIPFAFLAMAVALNLYLGGAKGKWRLFRVELGLRWSYGVFAALVVGALAFLNTWDFPMYAALLSGAYVLARARTEGWGRDRLWDFLALGAVLGVGGLLFYLPFFISFSSQAGGILPNLAYPTRGAHLWVMFGLFFVPLFGFLWNRLRQEGTVERLRKGTLAALGVLGMLALLDLLIAGLILALPALESMGLGGPDGLSLASLRDQYLDSIGAAGTQGLLAQAAGRRLANAGGWLTLTALLALTLAALWPRREAAADEMKEAPLAPGAPPSTTPFTLLLILLATLLVLGPEFVYLQDQFGWRINTIFKFYFQAWLIWGVAVAFITIILLRELRGRSGWAFRAGAVLLLGIGMIYPALGVWDRARGFQPPQGFNLDGTLQGHYLNPDEQAAVEWLRQAPYGVIVEAVGGSYSQYARVSAHSGNPTVIGWPGHESQWGRKGEDLVVRQRDVEQLYRARVWTEVERVLDLYEARYVFLGSLERGEYGASDRLFQQHMRPVFQQGSVTIFEVRP
jgi:YYY domain-containing protein